MKVCSALQVHPFSPRLANHQPKQEAPVQGHTECGGQNRRWAAPRGPPLPPVMSLQVPDACSRRRLM